MRDFASDTDALVDDYADADTDALGDDYADADADADADTDADGDADADADANAFLVQTTSRRNIHMLHHDFWQNTSDGHASKACVWPSDLCHLCRELASGRPINAVELASGR